MNQPMTPQERAAELCFKLALLVDAGTHMEVDTDAMKAIAEVVTATRRAALLEAAQVAITYGGRARDEDLSGSYTSELIVQALDRLAQEG